ncbi:hypothetical protein BUALT_Bualt02G0243700 [Buddleja alternifolia]|uniref:UBC core domain-containing protein n=1 Tax=Buddleja alternifolia TaxID=168488 RepID=A0AAV6Y558_9LAMI|nr:hypothetical protein BUALT_Bualt02G0243700 [Buddleja alternifolia]
MDPTNLPLASYIAEYRRKNTNPEHLETKKIFGDIEEIEDEVESIFNCFKNFDIIDYPPHDHRFRYNISNLIFPKSTFSRRVVQEWSLLEENLPNSGIFVRAYENKIQLMRAVIIGPPGSPYHHCLFFFDILLPKNYPSVPPKLYYHSYGLDLNPILRPDGGVRLPLLETRYKRFMHDLYGSNKEEKWEPKETHLLHVLHAIQNSILQLKPESPETSRFSCYYNKSEELKNKKTTFALMCENMIRVLRNPPTGFEGFVVGHFRRRAHTVLLKFKENRDYSQLMIDLFVSLFKVFERNGAYSAGSYYNQVQIRNPKAGIFPFRVMGFCTVILSAD